MSDTALSDCSDVTDQALPAAAVSDTDPDSAPSPVTLTGMDRTITVTGTGVVTVPPDCARISFGVQVQGVNAQDALRRSNEAMHAIVAAVKERGVDAADLQTNLWPGERGYTGSNDVSVLVRDITALGGLIDTVAEASGPNLTMHGVSMDVLDAAPHRVHARGAAVAAAREIAEQLAAAAGCALGEVVTIAEGGVIHGAIGGFRGVAMAAMDKGAIVEPGSHEVRADVTVTYRLVDAV